MNCFAKKLTLTHRVSAFRADPKERLVVVYGTVAPGEIRKHYREQVGALVYRAMQDLPKVVK